MTKEQMKILFRMQQSGQRAMRAQVSADLEERKWIAPHHIGATLTYRSTPQGQYIHTLTCYFVVICELLTLTKHKRLIVPQTEPCKFSLNEDKLTTLK